MKEKDSFKFLLSIYYACLAPLDEGIQISYFGFPSIFFKVENPDPHSLPELVRKISQGDEQSFGELYRIFSKKVYHTSRKMNLNHEEAEEVVQEVFIKIWVHRLKLDPFLSINAYIIAIIRSVVIKMNKKKARAFAFQQYDLVLDSSLSDQSADGDLIYSEYHQQSMLILDKLPPAQKQIFTLRHLENKSVDEISKRLNLSPRTVENQIFKATKFFKEGLDKLEIVSVSTWIVLIQESLMDLLFNC